MDLLPFHALDGATITISATTSSGNTNLPMDKMPTGKVQIRFYNAGLVPVFWRKSIAGVSGTALVASDTPIAPGSVEVFTLNNNPNAPVTGIAAITGSSTATLYATLGAGS